MKVKFKRVLVLLILASLAGCGCLAGSGKPYDPPYEVYP